jgi:hypothetical protein
MKKEYDDELCRKYPLIFKERRLTMDKTAMCWGFQFDDGWKDLMDKTCSMLDAVRKASGIVAVASTAKEKFGTLRFYYHEEWTGNRFRRWVRSIRNRVFPFYDEQDKVWIEVIDSIVSRAEHLSSQTCEVCGEYGRTRSKSGWLKTLCKEHAEQMGYASSEDELSAEDGQVEVKIENKKTEKTEPVDGDSFDA